MNIDDYKKPAWANSCKALGFISFTILSAAAIQWAFREGLFSQNAIVFFGLAVGSFIHFFFVAWCVETFADIRHYARETAIALTSGKEEKAEDTKPNASQEQ